MTRAREGRGKRARHAPAAPFAGGEPAEPERPSEEEIRLRAYEIFLRRGGAPGRALEDWLAAERALLTAGPGGATRG